MNRWERQRAAMDLEREWREKLTEGDAVMVHVNGYSGRHTREYRVEKRTPKRVIVDRDTFVLASGAKLRSTANGASVEIWQPGGARLALLQELQAEEQAKAREAEERAVLRRRIERYLQGLGLDELRAVAAVHGLNDDSGDA